MDSDFSQLYKQTPTKFYTYSTKKPVYYSDPYTQKSNKNPNRKVQYTSKQYPNAKYSKISYKIPTKDQNMNQLAPRFQQRALYSQHYRTDYDTSWRANLLAATCRTKYYSKNLDSNILKRFSSLGVRPDPEGAPSKQVEENDNSIPINDYDKVLNEETALYSDYGSESEDVSALDESKSIQGSNESIPNASWSTASLITHAFNKANSNKVTIMSFAVIDAELHSITKLHTSKTEVDLLKISKRTQKLTENIDKARKDLKEIALGLRACKQEWKSKNNKNSNINEKSKKHSSPAVLSKSDLSFNIQDSDKRFNIRKSVAVLDQMPTEQIETSSFPNYCTIDRRHRFHKERRSKRMTVPDVSLINYMNLESADKSSPFD